MKESKTQLSPQQIEQAILQCRQKIASAPKTLELHAKLGDLYLQQQQWQEAVVCYQKIVELEPFNPQAHRCLARVYDRLGEKGKVSDRLFTLYKVEPESFSVEQLYKLGQSLEAQSKPARAIVCYRAIIESQPDFFSAYETLATLLTKGGRKEPALEVYRLGVKHNPRDARYYLALAQTLAAQERWKWAVPNYQKVEKLDSDLQDYYGWGVALYELGSYPKSIERFQQAIDANPSPQAYYYQGLAQWQLKQADLAANCWQQAIALKQDYQEAYERLGQLWQQQQQWRKAAQVYKMLAKLNPRRLGVLVRLGKVYAHLQRPDLAVVCYTKVIECSPEGSKVETRAFALYQQLLANSTSATVLDYYRLARLYRSKSLFPQAIDNYQRAIKLDPQFRDAYIALQYTPIAPEKLADSIRFYRQLVEQYPDLTIAWGNLGDALTQNERVAQAIDCYRTASYQQAIQAYPNLAQLEWKEQKEQGPDFIVAGASKSGTSSIYFYLSRHPQILLSHTKEIDFYWQNYERGIDWYLAHFPTITDRDDFITGEATPNYLRFPQVAQRIKDTFPQTKIIILLRNPADRAISWHYHKLNTGLTNQNLGEAIAEEMTRLKTISAAEITQTGFYNPDNIISSLYIYKIKAWIELLGRDKFLILKSEDFYSDPDLHMSRVFKFLDLPNCSLGSYPKVNAGSYDRVDQELRATLVDYFAPYNQQLEAYLDMRFDWQ